MALSLKENEQIISTAQAHWSSFILTGVWCFLCMPGLGLSLSELMRGQGRPSNFLGLFVLAFFPLFRRFLIFKTTKYVLTNQRLHVEEGVVSRRIKDIPLKKINDVEFSQGTLQRLSGAGNLKIFTGNDNPTLIKGVDHAEKFKNDISATIEKATAMPVASAVV